MISMIPHLALVMLLAAEGAAPPNDWKPFHAFIGSWTGTRQGPTGTEKLTRDYESVARNQHLLVSDRVGSKQAPWGMVSIDPVRDRIVLRRFAPDGSATELLLSEVSNDGATLVFDTPPEQAGAAAERITHERHGWQEYVERVEVRANGSPFEVVSETHFKRKR